MWHPYLIGGHWWIGVPGWHGYLILKAAGILAVLAVSLRIGARKLPRSARRLTRR